jgi:hypothetical protein
MYDAFYFVFYAPNNSADIEYEYQPRFGIESIREYFFKYFFPDGKANPDVMSLYGMSCFHLDKLFQFEKDEWSKEDDSVQIQGRNRTFFVLKLVNDDSLERVQMVVAKKENTDFELLYIGEEDDDESVALMSEYEDKGYTVVSFVRSLL